MINVENSVLTHTGITRDNMENAAVCANPQNRNLPCHQWLQPQQDMLCINITHHLLRWKS